MRKGYIYLSEGRLEEAAAEFEGALLITPESVEAVLALGLVEVRRERLVEAAAYFEAVPPSSELYPEAQRQLALIALKQGESDRALAINPKFVRYYISIII
jgi:tetratricopeptide (TPR) repeat protein